MDDFGWFEPVTFDRCRPRCTADRRCISASSAHSLDTLIPETSGSLHGGFGIIKSLDERSCRISSSFATGSEPNITLDGDHASYYQTQPYGLNYLNPLIALPTGYSQATTVGEDELRDIEYDHFCSRQWIFTPRLLSYGNDTWENGVQAHDVLESTWPPASQADHFPNIPFDSWATFDNELPFPSSFQFSPSRGFECKWKGCTSGDTYITIEEHRSHVKSHAESAREAWKFQKKGKRTDTGMRCTWQGCTTKAKHKSEKLFEQHLVNIHINPLVCTVKHCKHTKPFRGNHDLQRHIATAHAGKSKYHCPFNFCSVADKGFPRKDKWIKHLQDHHRTEPCPYAHCLDDTFVACQEKTTADHIAKTHGIFECGLGSCEEKVSGFSDAALSEHLQVAHDMDWAFVLKAREHAKEMRNSTLRFEHLSENACPLSCKACCN